MRTELDADALAMSSSSPPTQALPPATEVLIVGAGPTGLSVALGLANHNISFTLVDAAAEGHTASRALGIQASGLEALAAFSAPLVDTLVSDGTPCASFPLVDVYGRPLFSLDLNRLIGKTKYPFCLMSPQHRMEKRIREALSPQNAVRWGKRVIDSREVETADGTRWEAVFESGERVQARYVVGADGTHSAVRTLSQIYFLHPVTNVPLPGSLGGGPRDDPDETFVVADLVFKEPVPANTPRDRVQVTVGKGGMVITGPIVPEPGQPNLYRVYLGINSRNVPSKPDAAFVQDIINRRGPGSHDKRFGPPPQIAELLGANRYRLEEALAERFVKPGKDGKTFVLLAGDAARRHGPAGGQGMNAGICDGCELADAIAEHYTSGSFADATPLETYETNRRSAAKSVMEMVRDMTETERGRETWAAWIKLKVLGLALSVPMVNGMMAWKLSGLGYLKTRLRG
ncbi:FAD/NAD(P)-binding domain-containing protein [Mycena chlorophos]|uniref:FAD/NAD(P)-binding domain-containing protein n=1 Tax=Mycena chlorophos TaxID=658473 RepID=A0A8H6RWR3_MYCCL|nr:FAD/NAD(P)-binding domain-containing protein [Mycena chlorophos]